MGGAIISINNPNLYSNPSVLALKLTGGAIFSSYNPNLYSKPSVLALKFKEVWSTRTKDITQKPLPLILQKDNNQKPIP